MFPYSEPVAASSNCSLFRKALCLCWPIKSAQAVPEPSPRSSAHDFQVCSPNLWLSSVMTFRSDHHDLQGLKLVFTKILPNHNLLFVGLTNLTQIHLHQADHWPHQYTVNNAGHSEYEIIFSRSACWTAAEFSKLEKKLRWICNILLGYFVLKQILTN